VDASRAPAAGGVRPPGWARAWGLPVWAHLLGLAAILLLLVPVVGPSESFIADEGAAMIQVHSLESGDGWIVEHPLPEVDPDGAWYPVVNAERGRNGFAPLAKHPLYPLLAAGAARVGGVVGMVLLSLAGTLAAAGLAAALAGRIDKALVRPALWTVGLASPLLFDGFLVMAHSLGAALASAAVLAAVVAIQDRRPAVALLVAPPLAGAVLLRNEALLFAATLALVAGVVALRRSATRVPAALVAATTLAAAVGARVVERMWISGITGGQLSATGVGVPAAGESFLGGRIDGFLVTWLTPSYGGPPLVTIGLLVMLGALVWTAVRVRRHPDDRAGILGSAAVAAAAAVVALAVAPDNVVPGLLLAFPVATAGMLALRRRLFDDVTTVVMGATAALFALAVIATQYSIGGSGEWGGRYFALAIPIVVPLLLAALWREGQALVPAVCRGVAGCLLVCTVALSLMAVDALRANHLGKADLVARIEAAGRVTGDDRPVVVTTWIGAPRLAWPTFDDHRWLYVPDDDVATATGRLRAAGIGRFVFVTRDLASVRSQLEEFTVVASDGPADGHGRQILVLGS
jgi:hypothetical protein